MVCRLKLFSRTELLVSYRVELIDSSHAQGGGGGLTHYPDIIQHFTFWSSRWLQVAKWRLVLFMLWCDCAL